MTAQRVSAGVTGWVWRPEASEGVGIVELQAAHGGRFWVDLLNPGTVVAFQAMTERALDGLGNVFGPGWRARIQSTEPSIETDDRWLPPTLSEGWRRLAVVESVRQWLPNPVDELLLLIDEALAWDEVGEHGQAAITIAQVSHLVVDLQHAAVEGRLPVLAADIVQSAAQLVDRSLTDGHPDRVALAGIETVLAQPVTERDFDTIESWLSEKVNDNYFALHLGDNTERDAAILDQPVDLLAVNARIVAWHGPHDPEIKAIANYATGEVTVSLDLAADVEPDDWEATQLITYLCESDTGALLAHASLECPDGIETRTLQATLSLAGIDPSTVTVGVYQADLAPEIRTSPMGRALSKIDRLLIASWASARLAYAGRSTRVLAEAHRLSDETATSTNDVIDAAARQAPTAAESTQSRRTTSRVRGFSAYTNELDVTNADRDLALRPLLAETLRGTLSHWEE